MPPNTTEWESRPKDLTWRATTELPNTVTDPQAAERIRKFYAEVAIPAESFAQAVAFAMSQPDEVDVNEILFRPTRQEL